jgi:HSP20 family protein
MANMIRRRNANETAPLASTYGTGAGWDPFQIMREMLGWDPLRETQGWHQGDQRYAFVPAFEILERKDGYVFKADMPGIREEDLDINLTENRLTVSGKRESEYSPDDGATYFARERSYGAFTRAFTLPEGVDGDKVQAELKHGVLTLTIPKKPEVQPKRIQIGVGGSKTQGAKS